VPAARSPIQVIGYVSFRDDPAVRIRYNFAVNGMVKNASKKGIVCWSVLFETNGGTAPGLNFTETHDYVFSGDVLLPGKSELVQSDPVQFGAAEVNGAPMSGPEEVDPPRTASARVRFVQFSDGSTWGDRDAADEIRLERAATLNRVQLLQRVYEDQGEKAFTDAFSEVTGLACLERIKTVCQNEADSSCARKEIENILAAAAHQRNLNAK